MTKKEQSKEESSMDERDRIRKILGNLTAKGTKIPQKKPFRQEHERKSKKKRG